MDPATVPGTLPNEFVNSNENIPALATTEHIPARSSTVRNLRISTDLSILGVDPVIAESGERPESEADCFSGSLWSLAVVTPCVNSEAGQMMTI
jgi:hypothetical protein